MLAACEQPAPPARQAARATVQIGQPFWGRPDPSLRAPLCRGLSSSCRSRRTYATGWWYFTGNLHGDDGARFGYQLTLFGVSVSRRTRSR